MDKWIPSRKYVAGGIVGIAAFFVAVATGLEGEVAMQIAAGLWALVSYFVPPSVIEIISRYDARIKRLGE
jgi:hypothetical protein|tara:strand:+ start:1057 stop:1266 length:210 start_codon:yes stop_codon:yes gene_type:complete